MDLSDRTHFSVIFYVTKVNSEFMIDVFHITKVNSEFMFDVFHVTKVNPEFMIDVFHVTKVNSDFMIDVFQVTLRPTQTQSLSSHASRTGAPGPLTTLVLVNACAWSAYLPLVI